MYFIKLELERMEAKARDAVESESITMYRKREQELKAMFQQFIREVRLTSKVAKNHIPKRRKTAKEKHAEKLANGWVDISHQNSVVSALSRFQTGSILWVRKTSFNSALGRYNQLAAAPKWSFLCAKYEPDSLKKHLRSSAATKRALVFRLEAQYG